MFVGYVLLEDSLVSTLLVENASRVPINADALPTFRVYGPHGFLVEGACTLKDGGTLSNASNATPIVITSTGHGLTSGTRITVSGVTGNTAANGTFTITRVDANSFSLDDSVGSGAYAGGGDWNVTGLYGYQINALGSSGFEMGECYQVLFSYQIATIDYGQLHAFNVD